MPNTLPQAVFFDFDGVLVDSNQIKAEAFVELFQEYDQKIIDQVIEYHLRHGGVSRIIKIQHAFDHFIGSPLSPEQLDQLANDYSALVFDKVINAEWIPGARKTLETLHDKYPVYVISGTPQDELRQIIALREMQGFFSEILGSPLKKTDHLHNLCHKYGYESEKCVFIGDAFTDLEAAEKCGMQFIGIQGEITFPGKVKVLPDCLHLYETIIDTFR